ncbi:hypothetical protein CPB84DRAFT_1774661 [Gymnopilus junonius]|uniref:Uncharacterized protein n=1 Tax=Gymnopilus junonius TaxID=109634 RepID=A0A9P5NSX3_GYMJU|nr:hypothetical protein CPB84DRAFT_1774661 [Gymnopilus junonius]
MSLLLLCRVLFIVCYALALSFVIQLHFNLHCNFLPRHDHPPPFKLLPTCICLDGLLLLSCLLHHNGYRLNVRASGTAQKIIILFLRYAIMLYYVVCI